MYVLIGSESDQCCGRAAQALRERHLECVIIGRPLGDDATFTCRLSSTGSESWLKSATLAAMSATSLQGVLVPWPGESVTRDNAVALAFDPRRAEESSALLAWLWTLKCPVVNRLPANLWFRPHRSPVEWQPILLEHGLRAACTTITKNFEEAHRFGDRWSGAVTYRPVTSTTRYPVTDEIHWTELKNVMRHVPVCLVQSFVGPTFFTCVAGRTVSWSRDALVGETARTKIVSAMREVAAALSVSTLQLELGWSEGALLCAGVSLFPELERYRADADRIVHGLLGVLTDRR